MSRLGEPGEPDVEALAAGGFHTCALLEDATLRCWGLGAFGQLGDGANSWSSTPAPVLDLIEPDDPNVTAIVAGSVHTCAVVEDAAILCWGYNDNGQLGTGNFGWSSRPVEVLGLG